MKTHLVPAALLFALCCSLFCLCACHKPVVIERTVSQETLRTMQKTQSELSAYAVRCRAKAEEYPDRADYLLALANSQQTLADYHETIINALQKKFKFERSSNFATVSEMDPWLMVLDPPEEYERLFSEADSATSIPEILNVLEFTGAILSADKKIEAQMKLDSEEPPTDTDFYLCTLCGKLSTQEPEGNCPVCHSGKNQIVKLVNGEIPPRKREHSIDIEK